MTKKSDRGTRWGRRVLILLVLLAGLYFLGRLSSNLTIPSTITETKSLLQAQTVPAAAGTVAADPCWVEVGELEERDLPEHFAQGPGRFESTWDKLFFKPGHILRPVPQAGCESSAAGATAWGYVDSKSSIPFFVRTHFGYFERPDLPLETETPHALSSGTSVEGVRTYFAFFGKKVPLNQWAVDHIFIDDAALLGDVATGDDMEQAEHDKRIDYIEFATGDIGATKTFYQSVFGWRFTDYGPDYTSFEDGRITGGFRTDIEPTPGGALVVVYSTDLESLLAEVKANGGKIVQDIFSFPGGKRFHFKDPSGNELAAWSDR